MSTVGGSGSSDRQDGVVRRNREDYQNKESELVKKHHKEIRRINEEHYLEIEKLKQSHDKQMRAMQDASRKAVTQRDQRHQGDIESMRSVYKKQMQNLSQEATRREDLVNEARRSEKDQGSVQMEARIQRLNDDFQTALREKEDNFNRALEINKEAQKRGMADQREKLESAHKEEVKFLREDRDRKVANLKREYDSYRKFATQEQQRQEIQGIQNQQRGSEALLRAVNREREGRVQSEQTLRDGFSEGLADIRARYEKSMENERIENAQGREYLNNTVHGRIGEKMRSLESENVELKESSIRDATLMEQKKKREVKNLKEAFTKNMQDLERQRDEAVRMANQSNKKDVVAANQKYDRILFERNREHLQRIEDINNSYRDDYGMLESTMEARVEQTQKNADLRVRGIASEAESSKQRMAQSTTESIEVLKRSHVDEMRAMRFQLEDEKKQAIASVKKQAQDREIKHQEQMGLLKAEQKKEILALQDEMRSLKKSADDHLKRTVDELNRAHQVSLEQQEYRHKDKLQGLEQEHSTRLKTINRRNDERMDQMAVAIQKKRS